MNNLEKNLIDLSDHFRKFNLEIPNKNLYAD